MDGKGLNVEKSSQQVDFFQSPDFRTVGHGDILFVPGLRAECSAKIKQQEVFVPDIAARIQFYSSQKLLMFCLY